MNMQDRLYLIGLRISMSKYTNVEGKF